MGLEVWANGSRDELDLMRRMLDANGRFLQPPGDLVPFTGADKGRYRQYFRLAARLS
jgi:hypothetical protein